MYFGQDCSMSFSNIRKKGKNGMSEKELVQSYTYFLANIKLS